MDGWMDRERLKSRVMGGVWTARLFCVKPGLDRLATLHTPTLHADV